MVKLTLEGMRVGDQIFNTGTGVGESVMKAETANKAV